MQVNLVIESNDPEIVWNAFRFARTALDAGHGVETFLLGDGVYAPEVETDEYHSRGVVRAFVDDGGTVAACGTCLDSRELEESELRPRASMEDMVRIVEEADRLVTFG